MRETVLSIYGNTAIKRGFCVDCDTYAFVLDDKLQCCDKPFKGEASKVKREVEPEYRRRVPRKAEQASILAEQDYRCIYCERAFGSQGIRRNKPVTLMVHWDHSIPYTYSANNKACNFVAACHVCNGLKSDLIFRDIDDARLYLKTRRNEKGYDW